MPALWAASVSRLAKQLSLGETNFRTHFHTRRRRGSDLRAVDVAAEGQPEALWVRPLVQAGREGSSLKLLLIN